MPNVAGRSANVVVRDLRMIMLRAVSCIALVVLSVAAIIHIWLALAAQSVLPLPSYGSALFAMSAVLDPSIEVDRTVSAASAALAATDRTSAPPGAENAQNLLRIAYAQRLIARSLERRPLQPRLWLSRASLLGRADPDDPKQADNLKMVYYTSPAASDLTIERLRAGLNLRSVSDPELNQLLKTDVAAQLLQHSQNRAVLVDLYRAASPNGQAFLARAVAELDPAFASQLR
ncbi:hypothetical protein JQ604_00875 [Bradyrhizobium jicamae]|uniref:hypothetical protein n=1 Tax=Bradyrhizobium jicamae TaxID=280332 RepID=UPI001BADB3E1|nr:hypothetical protein [Bradyrhizobium jicamae]MBR0750731.1 hypothetical protein [Bradyrhizobium jicamae]